MQKKSEIIVFAGPNGSGKTTVTKLAKVIEPYINADDIKKQYSAQIWRQLKKQRLLGNSLYRKKRVLLLKQFCLQEEILIY